MTSVMHDIKPRVLAVVLAAIMVFGFLAATAGPAHAITPTPGQEFFFMSEDPDDPARMGHDCVKDYDYPSATTIKLELDDGYFSMGGIDYTGHISSFIVDDDRDGQYEASEEKFVAGSGHSGTVTYVGDPEEFVPVQITVTITNPLGGPPHAIVPCYVMVP